MKSVVGPVNVEMLSCATHVVPLPCFVYCDNLVKWAANYL